MQKIIHFRDWGCQGVREIVSHALDIYNEKANIEIKNTAKIVFYTKENEKASLQIELWKEVASSLGTSFLLLKDFSEFEINSLDSNHDKFILVLDDQLLESEYELIEAKNLNCAFIPQTLGDDNVSSNALSLFTGIVFTAFRTQKPFTKLSYALMGDSGTKYADFSNSFLSSSMCLRHNLSFAFAENPQEEAICNPQKENLGIAMQAGSKIFLCYDPALIDENVDVLYISEWTYKKQGNFTSPAHPFTYETISSKFNENTQIISLIPEVQSSSYDEVMYNKALIYTRIALINYYIENL